VQSKTRYVVVPDYFGDDVVIETGAPSPQPSPPMGERGAEGRGRRSLYLPAENFCLNLLEGGDAILMSVWQSSEQDVWLGPSPALRAPSPPLVERDGVRGTRPPGPEDSTSLHVRCLKGKSIWLAFLESPDLWHASGASVRDDRKPPFPAKWRCGFVREDGVADSWTTEKPEAGVAERRADFSPRAPDSPTAKRPEGRAPNASLLVYPIDRSAATPLTVTCPTDVMRNTLGVGPCQYILACEGLAAQGDPTPNSVMNWVEKQFEGKKEKRAADDIQERLQTMTEHVAHARARIERYAEFAGQARRLIANKPSADAFRSIVEDMDRFIATGLGPAASPEHVKQLATEVSALIGKENALPACQRLGEQLRSIGAVQDGTLARCRMAVRRLKQQGRTDVANHAPATGLAQEVQSLAEQMLQKK